MTREPWAFCSACHIWTPVEHGLLVTHYTTRYPGTRSMCHGSGEPSNPEQT